MFVAVSVSHLLLLSSNRLHNTYTHRSYMPPTTLQDLCLNSGLAFYLLVFFILKLLNGWLLIE